MNSPPHPSPEEIVQRIAAPTGSPLPLPRALLVFAHPDDEVIALGGRLERFRASRFFCVTNGALPDIAVAQARGFQTPEAYAAGRRLELEAALQLGGIATDRARYLRVEAQHEVIVDQQAALHLAGSARALAREIAEFAPEAIVTHPYEGGHPDHDSCAFAVHSALRLFVGAPTPVIVEATFYHADPNSDEMETGKFLSSTSGPNELVCDVSPEECKRKQSRLDCFPSQSSVLGYFKPARELYRLAPEYVFTHAPLTDTLLYERWPAAINGEQFRALAAEALRELGLPPA